MATPTDDLLSAGRTLRDEFDAIGQWHHTAATQGNAEQADALATRKTALPGLIVEAYLLAAQSVGQHLEGRAPSPALTHDVAVLADVIERFESARSLVFTSAGDALQQIEIGLPALLTLARREHAPVDLSTTAPEGESDGETHAAQP